MKTYISILFTLLCVSASNASTLMISPGTTSGSATPEVSAYVTANSVTSPLAISQLNAMELELKSDGMWSNLITAVPFEPQFNASGTAFLGKTYTNRDFTIDTSAYGFGATNFGSPIKISLGSSYTNLTVVIVWKYPTTVVQSDVSVGVLGNGNKNGVMLNNQNFTFSRLVVVTNNVQGSSYLNDIVQQGYPFSSYYYGDDQNFMPIRGVEVFAVDSLAGKNSFWRNTIPGALGYSAPDFTNSTVAVGPLDTLVIGGDPTGNFVNTRGFIESIFVFRGYQSSAAFQRAAIRATRCLNSAEDDWIITGDSRNYPRFTNSWDFFFASHEAIRPAVIYNISQSGSQLQIWADNVSSWSNLLGAVSGQQLVKNKYFIHNGGINDFAYSNINMTTFFTKASNFWSAIPSDIRRIPQTVFAASSTNTVWNGNGVYSWSFQETNRVAYNTWLRSNASSFYALCDMDYFSTPQISDTNKSQDGVHFFGANGTPLALRNMADFIAKSRQMISIPQSGDATGAGSVTLSNAPTINNLALCTNGVAPAAIPGKVILWPSNTSIWKITTSGTNFGF